MTAPVTFRPARRDEVPAVLELLRDGPLDQPRDATDLTGSLAAYDAMQADPATDLILGLIAEDIVACYQIVVIPGLSLTAARRAQIEGVRVRADLRGQGIGAALMQDAETRARAAGCTLLQLTSHRQRGDAHRFYDRLGFTPSHIGYKKSL